MRHLFLLSFIVASTAAAKPIPASLFSDHAVLQRDRPIPVWGTADPGEKVIVSFAGKEFPATATQDGKWQVTMEPLPACSEPRDLLIRSTGQEPVSLKALLVGDVWLCSGQSNMRWPVGTSLNPEQEIANANYPLIRFFMVSSSGTSGKEVGGNWQSCSPQTVGRFSGAGYFFGRELHQQLKVPIGLIQSAVGGTPAESWTRLEVLQELPGISQRVARIISPLLSPQEIQRIRAERAAWEQKYHVALPPLTDAARGWASPDLQTSDWKRVKLPMFWARAGEKSGGVFWLRKEIEISEQAAGKSFLITLNDLAEQHDIFFFNGQEIGRTSEQGVEIYNSLRAGRVPANLVKAGRNVIALRIVSATQAAGVRLTRQGLEGTTPESMNEGWLLKEETHFAPLPEEALAERPQPIYTGRGQMPSIHYNGMIAPLMPYAIHGAIWYQGEGNSPQAQDYRVLLSSMIRDWRTQWGQGEFPFLIQQLVNFGPPPTTPNQKADWALIREAQMQVADSVPNCGISVGIDVGEGSNLHPPNKQDVGKRLALVALQKVYNRDIESSGPRYESMKKEGAAICVKFTHAAGLMAKGGAPKQFAIAGADGKFVWAEAKLEGESVVVSSPQVPQPVAVRYAWADNPEGCNLYNAAGLPAAPFRTDTH